ncbi:MAG: AarF/UbiB family protein [Chloroflexi bacterium]|nr:AarF/UbiB family protein [Chloroflexota bacterium]
MLKVEVDWQRYRKQGWFFAGAILHFLWWDRFLNRPILRRFRRAPGPRWRRMARAYCTMAVEMGGLPIKLGQFLSLRVDLLPPDVTQILAMLQDDVPAAPLAAIMATIEQDLHASVASCFVWFSPQPLASASLAQVHQAQLPSGEQVAVKVLRPGTASQIEMDLVVTTLLVRVLKRFPAVSGGIDLDLVLAEFSAVTRRELDFVTEGRSTERFANDFADDAQVYIPKVYWAYSGAHVLTLEYVAYLKIDEADQLAAAGIDQKAVAEQLARLVLKQILVTHFVHGDPHPGNLFIKPLPHPDENRGHEFAPGEVVPYWANRPFQIVLIDFGMTAVIPEEAWRWLQEFVIGVGLRDPRLVVQSYMTGGILRPGVDIGQIEALTTDILVHFQDALVGLMPDTSKPRNLDLLAQYRDLLDEYPFQFPTNLLFMYRALSTAGSIIRQLDPDFDLTRTAAPFANQLLWQTWQKEWLAWLQSLTTLGSLLLAPSPQPDRILSQARTFFKPPVSFQALFSQTEREPKLRTGFAAEDRKLIERLTKSVERLTWVVATIGVLLVSLVWQTGIPGLRNRQK